MDDMHDLLKVACSEAEQESDQIAEDFLDNKIDSVEQFLDTFMVSTLCNTMYLFCDYKAF